MHHEKVTLKATLFDVSTAGLHQTIAAQELNDTRPAGMGGEVGCVFCGTAHRLPLAFVHCYE